MSLFWARYLWVGICHPCPCADRSEYVTYAKRYRGSEFVTRDGGPETTVITFWAIYLIPTA